MIRVGFDAKTIWLAKQKEKINDRHLSLSNFGASTTTVTYKMYGAFVEKSGKLDKLWPKSD